MTEKENLQKQSVTESQKPKRKRNVIKVKNEPEQEVKQEVEDRPRYKWIRDELNATKTCEMCGGVMRGWAYREVFNYCPKCGNRMI